MVSESERTLSVRTARVLRWVLGAVFAISFLLFAVLMTLRYTVLDTAWYREILDENNTYERIYDRVLVDPEVKSVTDDLMGNLPVDRSLIDANLRLVIPPDTLRDTIGRTTKTLSEWLRKESDEIDAGYALRGLERNLERLNRAFLSDLIAGLEPRVTSSLEEFNARVQEFTAQIDAGETPTAFPTVPPFPGSEDVITDILMASVPSPSDELRTQVRSAVVAGDVNAALALVVPEQRVDDAIDAARDLTQDAGGDEFDFGEEIVITEDSPEVQAVLGVRDVVGDVLPVLTILSALLMALSAAALAYVAHRSGGSIVRSLAVLLIAGGLFVNIVWIAVRIILGDPVSGLTSRDSGLPRALRALLGDLGDSVFSSFDGGILGPGQIAIILGAATLLGMWLVPKVAALVQRQSHRRLVHIGIAAGVVVVVVAAIFVLKPDTASSVAQECNGHVELCDRRVDQVVFPMAHNAMSSSQRAWINANHDLALPGQLDLGVRGLMLDWWEWETVDRLFEFASAENLPEFYVSYLRTLVSEANPQRPGTYFCHGMCKLGHTRLVKGLREVKAWLDDNPSEVVVVIAEDHITAAQGERVMRRSGLADVVFTPPRDPSAPWPTLRTLIDRDRRLIFFTETRTGEAPWYRSGYDYMMETPYTFDAPEAMSCIPNRGGTGKRLFLMNHWIQKAVPSRADSGLVNSRRFILDRAERCAQQRGQLPNFISVDFATIGDVVGATDRLNRVED